MKSSARIGCSSAGTPTPFDLSGTMVDLRTFGPQSKVRTDLGTWIARTRRYTRPLTPARRRLDDARCGV